MVFPFSQSAGQLATLDQADGPGRGGWRHAAGGGGAQKKTGCGGATAKTETASAEEGSGEEEASSDDADRTAKGQGGLIVISKRRGVQNR